VKRNYIPTNYVPFTYSSLYNLQTLGERKKQCVKTEDSLLDSTMHLNRT